MRYAEGKASRPEGIRTESMPLQNCHPLKFWENYSAFANSGGGSINVYNTGGFDSDTDEFIAKIREGLFDRSVVSSNVLMESDIKKTMDGISVNVPSADRRLRPVFVGDSKETGTFARFEGRTVKCNIDNIRSMIRDSKDLPYDSAPVITDISILDMESVRAFRKSVGSKGYIWESRTDDEFLSLTSAAADTEGWLRPTYAGILLFSNYYTASAIFPGYRLKYKDEKTLIDSEDGSWTGNIIDFISKVSEIIDYRFPDICCPVNELIINALAHADYNFGEGIAVECSEENITISNAGLFRAGQELSVKGAKDRRNPVIAKILGMMSRCRGLGPAIASVNMAGYEISIDENHLSGIVTVTVKRAGLPRVERSPVAERILKEMISDGNVTVGGLSEKMGLSRRQIERYISDLKSDGSLVRVGSRRAGSWKVL
ncbi:MAG: ATP-dependent helicase RecG [Candidatus Methanomethylophilaceae archaeon]|nr:ATP-dependent helicase RecG [Candidatus Methanomethylophilaceae archaeon]